MLWFLGPVGLARQIGKLDRGTHYERGTSVSTELRVRKEICGAGGAACKESIKLRRPIRQVRSRLIAQLIRSVVRVALCPKYHYRGDSEKSNALMIRSKSNFLSSSLFAETRDIAASPLKASQAYKNIVDGLQTAKVTTMAAKEIIEEVYEKVRNDSLIFF